MNTKRKTTKPATGKRKLVAKFPDPPDAEKAQASAKLFLSPSVNAAAVAVEYLKGPFGNEQDMGALVETLSASIKDVWDGDTRRIEAMLYAQATALQTIFTNLARRANAQDRGGPAQLDSSRRFLSAVPAGQAAATSGSEVK